MFAVRFWKAPRCAPAHIQKCTPRNTQEYARAIIALFGIVCFLGCRPTILGGDSADLVKTSTNETKDTATSSAAKANVPELSYQSGNQVNVTVDENVLITPTTLKVNQGEITNCAVTEGTTPLPDWAVLDTLTCEISGKPDAIAPTTAYLIEATNANGSSESATLRLKVSEKYSDTNNNAIGIAGGTHYGTIWSNSKSALILGSGGGCNGSTGNCSELDASWTPKYDDIVGYWKFNGSGATTAGQAIPATIGADGISVHGAHAGTVTYSSNGKIKQTLNVGQTTDCVKFSRTATMEPESFTVMFWINPNENTTDMDWAWPTLFSKWDETGGVYSGYAIQTDNVTGGVNLYVGNGNGSRVVAGSDSIVLQSGTWYHIAGTLDAVNGKLRIYVNGKMTGENTLTQPLVHSTTDAYFGCLMEGVHLAPVKVDELALWSSALSAAEIYTIYDRQNPKGSGVFTSRVFNAQDPQDWSGLSWLTSLPVGKELPDDGKSETTADYADISANLMTGNVGLWHFNETAENTAPGGADFKDSSGKGNHAAIDQGTNVEFGAPGKLGGAIGFKGQERAKAPNSTSLQNFTESSHTFSAWVKPLGEGGKLIVGKEGYDVGLFYGVDKRFSFVTWWAEGGNSSVIATSANTYGNPTWVHVVGVATYNSGGGGTIKLYINGDAEKVSTTIPTGYFTPFDYGTLPLYFGAAGINPGLLAAFIGEVDEVAIWNRALSAAEVLQLFKRGSARVKSQIRTCSVAGCADEPAWLGPDGSDATFFSELQNNSSVDSVGAPLGTVNLTSPSYLWNAFTSLFVSANQYIQYRIFLESDGPKTPLYSPELKSVTVK